MAKMIITESQYKTILEHEKRQRATINEAEKAITVDLNVLLAIGTLLGFNISGHNKINAEEALKDESIFKEIKSCLESSDKLKEVVSSLEIKGMANPEAKLKEKLSTLVSKFNALAKENGFDCILDSKALVNLNALGQ